MVDKITYHVNDSKKPVTLKVMMGKQVHVEKKFGSLGAVMGYLLQNTGGVITKDAVNELRALKPFLKNSKFKFKPRTT